MNLTARPSLDDYFIQMARLVSTRATCLRRAVGCVLINDLGHVLATGYNGVPRGHVHCNEPCHEGEQVVFKHACEGANAASGTKLDSCHALHAEWNALLQCRDVQIIDTAYVTTQPCITCTKLFLNTSCKRIVFAETYSHPQAESMWLDSGREMWKFDETKKLLIRI